MRGNTTTRPLAGMAIAAVTILAAVPFAGAGVAAAATQNPRAGYQKVESGTGKATTTLVVPSLVACPPTVPFQAVAAGVSLVDANGHSGAFVAMACANGSANYIPVIQFDSSGTNVPHPVFPGDHVNVSVKETLSGTVAKMSDTTQGWTTSMSSGGTSVSLTTVGVLAVNCVGTVCSAVPQTTNTAFSGASIDGSPLTSATKVNLVSSNGTVEEKAGVLGAGGTGFTAKWKATCTPDASGRC